jgi:hypothetical protein
MAKAEETEGQREVREALAKLDGTTNDVEIGSIRNLATQLGRGGLESLLTLARNWAEKNNVADEDEEVLEQYLATPADKAVLKSFPKAQALLTPQPVEQIKSALQKAAEIDDRCDDPGCQLCHAV